MKGTIMFTKKAYVVKKTDGGYGIFIRTMQERPIGKYPTKRIAKKRLNEYVKHLKREWG